MLLNKDHLAKSFKSIGILFRENATALCQIDAQFGDGDHGITIGKIADLIDKKLIQIDNLTMYEFLDSLGSDIMGVNGGSAGPLYGTLVSALAIPLKDKDSVDATTLKEMFRHCLSEMEDISTAKIGDKTMMDALIPAVEAALASEDNILSILENCKVAASKGADSTKNFVAKYGRAKSYKEQTIGTKDAGAVSTALFFQGFANIN